VGITLLRFAGFELDFDRAALRGADGRDIKLRPKALSVLHVLATHPGTVFSKRKLMAAVWPNLNVADDSLFHCIREIRAALGDERRVLVRLISGRGYVLEAEVSTPDDEPAVPRAQGRGVARINGTPAATSPGAALAITAAPFITDQSDSVAVAMAANVMGQLTQGLSHASSVRLLASTNGDAAQVAPGAPGCAGLVLEGSLGRDAYETTLQARLIDAKTAEVRWSGSSSVAADLPVALQQSRLAAGVGHPLAVWINALACGRLPGARSKIVIEQATAPINHTSREHFATAQVVLEEALAATPDDIEVRAALADHLLLGVRTAWYRDAEASMAEQRAQTILEDMLKSAPNYLPALAAYCRLLRTTNRFVESLIACAEALSVDPWDGAVLFQLGMAQLQTGRFEDAFDTFRQADSYNAPAVSRWSWLFGAGFTKLMLDQSEEALRWLQAALAVTPSAGRVHFITAAAYQRLGQLAEAKAAVAKGLEQRPNATVQFLRMPYKNASPRFVAAAEQILRVLAEAGVPER
jgi:DNA-binding winged helix-turn-helix (wHTH) protein/tetratricopeptide (TPR) repeat protein